ncbi:hypothetical protein OG21DRAFT_1491787 [Imleria badia]|nr:hypothetical protein OG21DRAFT_1491787 [Imleria badia]
MSDLLEEPSCQASMFVLLCTIVARKLIVPELYNLIMSITTMLITSQSAHMHKAPWSLLQFLLDYQQGAGRLWTTLVFLVHKLSYTYALGWSSILKLLHALVIKFNVGLMAKYAEML